MRHIIPLWPSDQKHSFLMVIDLLAILQKNLDRAIFLRATKERDYYSDPANLL